MKVLLTRFHLYGHTIGFHPKIQKLEPPYETLSVTQGDWRWKLACVQPPPSPQATQAIENECSTARLSLWARIKEKRCDGWREICVLCHRHGYTRLLFISKSFCARLEIWQMFGVLDINMNKRTTSVRDDKEEVMCIHKYIFYWLVPTGLSRINVRQCWGKDNQEKILS